MNIQTLQRLHKAHPTLTIVCAVLLIGAILLATDSMGLSGMLRASLLGGETPCNDGLDNDGDGLTDYPADLGCQRENDRDEWQDGECFDGIDNDGDGAIDAADFGCRILFNGESMPKSFCEDGIDNDNDGNTDLADSGCSDRQDHSENG